MSQAAVPTAPRGRGRMTEIQTRARSTGGQGPQEFEFGGLRFNVAFRGEAGATLRVDGRVNGEWKELLRFDDFVDTPHYHAPADAAQINVDRAAHGDPMEGSLR